MSVRFTRNDMCNIRTMAMFVKDNYPISQVIKNINTGSYEYLIVADNTPNGVLYKVRKMKSSGKYIGTIIIDRITSHGMEYKHLEDGMQLPESVVKAIMLYNTTLNNYMRIGEKAFN